jgi:hypothetical protein
VSQLSRPIVQPIVKRPPPAAEASAFANAMAASARLNQRNMRFCRQSIAEEEGRLKQLEISAR